MVSHIEHVHIYIYIYKEEKEKKRERKLSWITEKKKNYCSGEGLEGNIRTIRARWTQQTGLPPTGGSS